MPTHSASSSRDPDLRANQELQSPRGPVRRSGKLKRRLLAVVGRSPPRAGPIVQLPSPPTSPFVIFIIFFNSFFILPVPPLPSPLLPLPLLQHSFVWVLCVSLTCHLLLLPRPPLAAHNRLLWDPWPTIARDTAWVRQHVIDQRPARIIGPSSNPGQRRRRRQQWGGGGVPLDYIHAVHTCQTA